LTKLLEMRKKRGINQKELARQVSRIPSSVCRLEKIGIKTTRVAKRYAKVLDCEPLELLEI